MRKKMMSAWRPGPLVQKNLLIMRLTMLLAAFGLFSAFSSSNLQKTKLNLKIQNGQVKEVLNLIENQSEFFFMYDNKQVDVERLVNIEANAQSLDFVLQKLFEGTAISYKVVNRQILLYTDAQSRSESSSQQQKTVTGKVTDNEGAPLPGVSVVVKGTTTGTITDMNGVYSLPNVPERGILQFSFVGMKGQEIPVGGKNSINVKLEEETIGIEEVVAVGYGSVKKSDLTGTVSSMKTDKTMDIPNTNALQALQGSVAGLSVTTSARPGENPEVNIRGINSLSASNSPLIVVDGIIYNGSLNDFNANDIEKMDVLKDASAAAVYGSRSSNGVIIVTTKMGKKGKPVLNFNSYYGLSDPVHLIPVLNGDGYIQKILDYRTAAGLESDPSKIESYLSVTETQNYKSKKTVDWYDNIIKTGTVKNYNVNISGQNDRTGYFLSGTYFDQKGIVDNDKFKRITLKANFTNKITDWYTISLRSAFTSMDYSGVAASLYYGLSPYGSYWENESKGIYKEFPMEDPFYVHPKLNTKIDNKDIRTSLLGTISSEMQIPFIKGLKWTLNYSANLRNKKEFNFWDNTTQAGGGKTYNGIAKKEIEENYDWTLDNIINYKRDFHSTHSVDLTLLYSREYQRFESTFAQGTDFYNQALGYNSLGLAKVMQTASNLEDQNSVAYMARLNYVLLGKYSLTATVRRDGFSGFSDENKYAVFPSLAFAWNTSNENFMKGIEWLNTLKTRVSYGENGNQALGRYQTLARIASAQYVFGDGGSTASSAYVESMANTKLGWETTKVANFGIDFGVLKNRIVGSIDIYSSNTYDILLKRNIPATSGYSTVWTNIGKVHNNGVEIALNTKNYKNNDWAWESGFTFALNRNSIKKLLGEDMNGDGKEDDNISNSWFIGKPLGVIYGYKTDGIYQLNDANIPTGFKPGDFRLVDTNKDGNITPDDRVILGSILPNYTFSISNTVKYKNLSLYMLINSIQGGGKDNYYVGNNAAMHNVNNPFSTFSERFNVQDVPYWTPNNPSNEYSRVNYNPSRPHPVLEDRSFVRLQDVNLSYQFEKQLIEKLKIQNLRVYVSGKNLYTWTKWTGYDPENMTSIGNFPMLRTFTFGVDVTF